MKLNEKLLQLLEAPLFTCGFSHFTQGYGWFGYKDGYID